MTDREAAAGLVESMPGVCDALDRMGMHILAGFCEDIGPTITTLLSELERVGEENDKLRDLHRRASEETGELLGRALKAEKERDNLKLQAQGHAMEARSANATIYDAYQAVTGATGEPGNWNGAEPIKAELDRLRALVAEAVRVLGGLGIKPPDGPLESILWGDMPEETLGTLSVQLKHLRAARAFIDRAKES